MSSRTERVYKCFRCLGVVTALYKVSSLFIRLVVEKVECFLECVRGGVEVAEAGYFFEPEESCGFENVGDNGEFCEWGEVFVVEWVELAEAECGDDFFAVLLVELVWNVEDSAEFFSSVVGASVACCGIA